LPRSLRCSSQINLRQKAWVGEPRKSAPQGLGPLLEYRCIRARALRCHDQTVRNAIHTVNRWGVKALQPKSYQPHRTRAVFDPAWRERLRAFLYQNPRAFG
jgi:winged helix-turn helix protein